MGNNREYRTLAREHLKAKNADVGSEFTQLPKSQWPPTVMHPHPVEVWHNNQFFVQVFEEPGGVIRLSINRTALKGFRKDNSPVWQDGISWDELQAVKAGVGFGSRWAVECYPPDSRVVNVANLRHLWVLPVTPEYGWNRGEQP